jgi:hypothetical protein
MLFFDKMYTNRLWIYDKNVKSNDTHIEVSQKKWSFSGKQVN